MVAHDIGFICHKLQNREIIVKQLYSLSNGPEACYHLRAYRAHANSCSVRVPDSDDTVRPLLRISVDLGAD